jgi:16S rRNA (guanine966-N2)-methyltransferase
VRVIAGELRGRRLKAPPGRATRPTSDRVREAVFDLLGPLPPGGEVLDLYAGSGALGIEALSRGAGRATFVERSRRALGVLRDNLDALGLTERSRVLPGEALTSRALRAGPYAIVFCDPPYGEDLAAAVLAAVGSALADDGVLVLEHPADRVAPPGDAVLALAKSRRYGGTGIALYRRHEESS